MFKKKATLAILMATLVVLVAPLAVQLIAGSWTCADLPSNCWNTTTKGCSGDVMYYSSCHLYCKTGVTTTPATHCHLLIAEPVDDDVTSSSTN